MNGRELVAEMRRVFPGIKHLFMSGYTADVITEKGVLDANTPFLQKPFSRVELGKKVRDALDRV